MIQQSVELLEQRREELRRELAQWFTGSSKPETRNYLLYFLNLRRQRNSWEAFARGFVPPACDRKRDSSKWLYKFLDNDAALREDWSAIGQDIYEGIKAALMEHGIDGRIEPAQKSGDTGRIADESGSTRCERTR